MKTINRLILLIIFIVLFLIVEKITGIFSGCGGQNKLKVEKTEIDFGREIFGNKISIRDNIRIRQKGNFYIDGNFLGFGNENKEIEISFISELGYFIEDIIRSEKIDSLIGNEIISRTLMVELPLPDTLSFIEMKKEEKDNEWFWEGWYQDNENFRARKEFITELKANAYNQFFESYISPRKNTSFK